MEINIEESCRICLNLADTSETIFRIQYNGQKISEVLKTLYPVEIDEDDNLPQKICSECESNLMIAFSQYKLVIDNDKNLRNLLNFCIEENNETESLEIEFVDEEGAGGVEIESDQAQLELNVSIDKNISEMKIECNICEKSFVSNSRLKSHMNLHSTEPESDGTTYLLENDDLTEIEIDKTEDPDFNETIKAKTRMKKYTCEIPECKKAFDKPSKLKRHMNVHNTNKKPFECPKCQLRFATSSALDRHDITMHSGLVETTNNGEARKPKCMICNREFPSQESLSSHLKCHKEELKFVEFACDLCPKTFQKLNQLTRHSKTHVENKNIQCNLCGKMFSSGSHLVNHLNLHKGIKLHSCPLCDKSFSQSCSLKDHIRTHSEERPFLCNTCGKGFNNNSNLRQHVLRHTNERPFACKLCPSRFNCKGGLTSHMLVHTKVKNHVCGICGKSFTKGFSLKKHTRLHTGERPYVCEVCGMRFNSSDHVKRHMRTHTGERPYKCQYCDKSYAQSNDLVKHLRSHVGENTYVCEIDNCKQSFRLQSELRDHYSTHYQQNESQIENIVSDSQENQKVFLIKTENVTEITTNSKEHSEIA